MIAKHIDLLPCPFCGGKASIKISLSSDTPFTVECDDWYCVGFFNSEHEAIAAWNRRESPVNATLAEGVNRDLYNALKELWILCMAWDCEFMDDPDFNRNNITSALSKALGATQ